MCRFHFYDTSIANGDGAVGYSYASFNIDHRDMVDYQSFSTTHDGSREEKQPQDPVPHGREYIDDFEFCLPKYSLSRAQPHQ
jgi:hypothetical protein